MNKKVPILVPLVIKADCLPKEEKEEETGLICVGCGKNNATEGSAKHPYCWPCFYKAWGNDYKAYFTWLEETH